MKRKYNVNLLLKRKERIGEDIVYFLLHYFRYILVITQIVIIIVFFYRLKVDQEIVDLNETLRQQKEILGVLQPFIKDAQTKYKRYLQVKTVMNKQEQYSERLDYLLSVFPADFYLNELTFGEKGVSMKGRSTNYLTIMRFYNRLKKDSRFSKITLDSIDKQGAFFVFSFELSDFKFVNKEK